MPFRLRRDARDWFSRIRPALQWDFDIYYLCLIAGMGTGQKADATQAETAELVDYFPGDYQKRGRLLVAMYLAKEVAGYGVSMDDRSALHEAIKGLIHPDTPTKLSDEGVRQFNRYSHGGFDVITQWFNERPQAIETFLPKYFDMIQGV